MTDGQELFWRTAREMSGSDPELERVRDGQFAFWPAIERTLRSVEYRDGISARWWPQAGGKRTVVVDPAKSFGQPILADSGIPTRAIADSVEAEGDLRITARLFDVRESEVRDAVRFERSCAA